MAAPKAQTPGGNRASADTKPDAAIVSEQSPSDKTWATFRARCAMAGVRAWRTVESGTPVYIVSHLTRTRDFHSLDDARRWLSVVSRATDA